MSNQAASKNGDDMRRTLRKSKLRLSSDNRSVAKVIIHFPVRKLLTFCSIFTDLLPPQDFDQALDAAGEMPAIRAEWQVEQFRGGLLGGRGMEIGLVEGAKQFLVPRMDAQGVCRFVYFGP